MFYTPDQIISTVQNFKRQVVDQTVTNETVKKGLHAYIDSQEKFVKTIVQNAFDISTEAMKFPFFYTK